MDLKLLYTHDAFYIFIGFTACSTLIIVAKLFGLILKKPENYYSTKKHD
ncbi:MAG: hypothetical protein ACK4OM_07415 [Alphaproteobacteria bacterium]